jgi:GNAT superfamily N-acetyltransferase
VPDSNNNEVVEYRAFTLDDLPAAHALSASVKWRHRADDWRFAARIGSGFAAVDQNGALVGTALAFQFGADAATLGMFIVSPEHQRRGIGRGLLDRLRAKLGPRMLLIHASNEGKPLCVERGFETIDTIHQHQGAAFQPPLVSLPPGERLRPIGAKDTPRLAALASRASGLDRTELMPQLLDVASGIALDRDGELIGFALNAGMFVRIDTPLRYGLSSWLEGLGLPLVDTIEQMALNGKPSTDATFTQFALTSQAVW